MAGCTALVDVDISIYPADYDLPFVGMTMIAHRLSSSDYGFIVSIDDALTGLIKKTIESAADPFLYCQAGKTLSGKMSVKASILDDSQGERHRFEDQSFVSVFIDSENGVSCRHRFRMGRGVIWDWVRHDHDVPNICLIKFYSHLHTFDKECLNLKKGC